MIKPGGVLFDLDGVIFQGNSLISGSKEILSVLTGAGIPYRFITNTTRMTKNNLVKMLGDMGLAVDSNDIFAAPHAAAEYCELKGYNKILLFVPDQEMQEDFSAFQLVENNPDAVVVGDMGALFTFGLLNKIFRIIIDGAELVAMHKNHLAFPDQEQKVKFYYTPLIDNILLQHEAQKKHHLNQPPNPYYQAF